MVVELVDTLALGASARKGMRVRVSPAAPKQDTSQRGGVFIISLSHGVAAQNELAHWG